VRQDEAVEGALPTKHQGYNKCKKKKNWKNQPSNEENSFRNHQKGKGGGLKKTYPPCQHYGKKGHPPFK